MDQETIKSPFSILFVDDEENARKYFNKGLKHEYNILTAGSVDEAKEILAENHQNIAIVITDQRMPGGNGVILLKFLRENYPHIIRLLTTAYSDLTEAIEAVNSGEIFRYIQKPWDYHLLKTEMGQAIELFELRFERNQMLGEKLMVKRNLIKSERVRALILTAKNFNFIKKADASMQNFIKNFASIAQEEGSEDWDSFDFGNKDVLEAKFLGNIIEKIQQSAPYNSNYEFDRTLSGGEIAAAIQNISENANLNIESSAAEQENIKINLNSFNIALKKLIAVVSHSQEKSSIILNKIDGGISISLDVNQLSLEKGGNIFITNPEKTDIGGFYIDLLICFLIFGHHGGVIEADLNEESLKLVIKLPNNPQEVSFLKDANSESLENAILSSMIC